jgi:hypothetical protein
MSKDFINQKLLRSLVSVYRKSLTVSDIGDFAETADTLVYSSLPAFIQPRTSDLSYEIEGNTHFQTHIGYVNNLLNGSAVVIKVGDTIADPESGIKHIVIGIEDFRVADADISGVHHFKLILEAVGDYGEDILADADMAAKVKIA